MKIHNLLKKRIMFNVIHLKTKKALIVIDSKFLIRIHQIVKRKKIHTLKKLLKMFPVLVQVKDNISPKNLHRIKCQLTN